QGHDREHLGGQEGILPASLDGPAHDPLRAAEAVYLGRVDEVDTQVKGPPGDGAGLVLGVVLAVAPLPRAVLPGPQADGRDPDPSHLDVAHGSSLRRAAGALYLRRPGPYLGGMRMAPSSRMVSPLR